MPVTQLLRPWGRTSTWWTLVHLLLDLPVGVVTFTVIVTLAATSVALLITFPLAVITIWLLFVAGRGLAAVERTRVAALLDLELADPVSPLPQASLWKRWTARFTCPARWKELGYLVLALPVGVVTFSASLAVWCGSAALLGLPFYAGHLPGGAAHFGLFSVGPGPGAWVGCAVGLVGLVLAAPWLTVGLGQLDRGLARLLLAPSDRARLAAQVSALETSRVAAVDSAEAERRRIERDLHDGAQQRLVALAVTLGEARQRMAQDPAAAEVLVAESHEEAKAALVELRDLVRGIHPVILEDRGLDAALSAVVAHTPVPVTLDVDVAERPPSAVESAAYFVVSEALTNVGRHAQATRAWVTIVRHGDRLLVEVRDDGIGGAVRPAGGGPGSDDRSAGGAPGAGARSDGTGLAGLADRVSARWAAGWT